MGGARIKAGVQRETSRLLGGYPAGGHRGREPAVPRTRIRRWEWVCLWPVCASVALSLFSLRSQQRLFGKFQPGSAVRRTGSVRSSNLSRHLLSECLCPWQEAVEGKQRGRSPGAGGWGDTQVSPSAPPWSSLSTDFRGRWAGGEPGLMNGEASFLQVKRGRLPCPTCSSRCKPGPSLSSLSRLCDLGATGPV